MGRLQAIMKMQVDPDGRTGHLERERIRKTQESPKPSHNIPNHNRKLVIDEVEFTSTVTVNEIKDCPSYVKGCHITNCILCKKREWDLYCRI